VAFNAKSCLSEVGGHYSMIFTIGLSTIAIAPENFRALLDGFHKMDEHFLRPLWIAEARNP
jgi:glucose-6-phosphate isomerase